MKSKKEKNEKKPVSWGINDIFLTVQRGYERHTIRVKNSDIYKWLEKYRSCTKKSRFVGVLAGCFALLTEWDWIVGLVKREKVQHEITWTDVVYDFLVMMGVTSYAVIHFFIYFSSKKARAVINDKFSE